MSRLSKGLPNRLLTGEATEFQRRVLDSALEKRPSAEASARIAKALGVTVTTVGTAAAAKALAATTSSKAAAAASASTVWPWISAGLLGLVVAGAAVGVHLQHAPAPEPARPTPTVPTVPEPATRLASRPAAEPSDLVSAPDRPIRRSRGTPAGSDLRDEIAVVDAARAAVSSGDPYRTLQILRGYEARYPSGSFRPEARAIRIEALVKLGRRSEAQTLAARFVNEHPGTLLAKRVADLVGLSDPPTTP